MPSGRISQCGMGIRRFTRLKAVSSRIRSLHTLLPTLVERRPLYRSHRAKVAMIAGKGSGDSAEPILHEVLPPFQTIHADQSTNGFVLSASACSKRKCAGPMRRVPNHQRRPSLSAQDDRSAFGSSGRSLSGLNGLRSTVRVAPSSTSSAIASPEAGAFSMPHTLWPVAM